MNCYAQESFILQAAGSNCRLDGRGCMDGRPFVLDVDPTQRGNVRLSIGNTCVLAVTTATPSSPHSSTPSSGSIHYQINLTPLAKRPESHQDWEDTKAPQLQRWLERSLKNTRIVDLESLCVVPGEWCWKLRVDLHVVGDDGALIDALSMAAIASLYDFRRLDAQVQEDGSVKIFSEEERNVIPLSMHNPAIVTSFAIVDPLKLSNDHATKHDDVDPVLLMDPCEAEEVVGGILMIAMNRNGQILTISKTSGPPLDPSTLEITVFGAIKRRVTLILTQIKQSLSTARQQYQK